MDLRPSDEQIMLRDTARRFLADRRPPAEAGRGPIDDADWRAMGELGLLALAFPEHVGGMAAAPQDCAIVAEELGRALAVTPFAETILGAAPLLADTDVGDAMLASVVAGERLIAWAEGDLAASDGALQGTCRFVKWGARAAGFVVVSGENAWFVEADAPGVSRSPVRLTDGSFAATLVLDGCVGRRLPASRGDIERARSMIALGYVAEMVGTMATLLEQTVAYAAERRQFGVPISSFQVVQHKMARMFVRLEQSRSMLLKASLSDGDAFGFAHQVLAAKAYVSDAAQSVAEEAVQLHGGMGVTDELPVGRALRRVMLVSRLFGRPDEARRKLAA